MTLNLKNDSTLPQNFMLTENKVINILVDHLYSKKDYKIIKKSTTTQHGYDIIAEKNNIKLFIEAKGNTSSRVGVGRYGQPFTKKQVVTHISVAILKTLKTMVEHSGEIIKVGMAFPDNKNHRDTIMPIAPLLKKMGIIVYLVEKNSVNEL